MGEWQAMANALEKIYDDLEHIAEQVDFDRIKPTLVWFLRRTDIFQEAIIKLVDDGLSLALLKSFIQHFPHPHPAIEKKFLEDAISSVYDDKWRPKKAKRQKTQNAGTVEPVEPATTANVIPFNRHKPKRKKLS